MKHKILLLVTSCFVLVLASCEDVIYPPLEPASPVLVVDAWITNTNQAQTIVLTSSQPYFDATVPPPVSGAVVAVSDDMGKVFSFTENPSKAGHYEWTPSGTDTLRVGGKYQLSISVGGETFTAASQMGRVPPIDSITFDKDTNLGNGKEITRAEFWATDPVGHGDAYWIRSYKNGVPLLRPSEINIAYDAGVSIGGPADGVIFIAPVRRRINANDRDDNNQLISPIVNGDSIQVQIHSVTVAAFTYLNQVQVQTNRPGGFAELFATPLANVSTNVFNANPSGSKVVGFFNTAAVSCAGKRYKE